jgi:hypothetical protein
MNHSKYQTILWCVFLTLISVLLLAWPPLLTQAGPELPSRETPTPPVQPPGNDDDEDEDDKPAGAFIALQVQSAPAGVWTIVQWQDSAGGWHDVDGWQGTLDEGDQKMWWLAADLFGKGPFRWMVYQGPGGPVWGVSESFSLPAGHILSLAFTSAEDVPGSLDIWLYNSDQKDIWAVQNVALTVTKLYEMTEGVAGTHYIQVSDGSGSYSLEIK